MGRLKEGEIPKRRHHKASGRDVVTLSGKEIPLGRHDSPEAISKYQQVVAVWLANGRKLPTDGLGGVFTVADLARGFLRWADGYYVKAGKPTTERANFGRIASRLVEYYGPTPAADFGPLALKALRQTWVADGCARETVNRYARSLIHIFSWGVEEEVIPKESAHALREVKLLASGRTEAPELEDVPPAPLESVAAVLAIASGLVADLMRLQLQTAMRPGEACAMKPQEIDRSGKHWVYRPKHHKSEHKKKTRAIYLGPRSREILAARAGPDLGGTGPGSPLFPSPQKPKSTFQRTSYRRAVARYCKRAGVPHFSPNQLRHSALTAIRDKLGLEVARIVAGHSDASTTTIYAQRDEETAQLHAANLMG